MTESPNPDTETESAQSTPEPAAANAGGEIETLKADAAKYKDLYLRTQADLENYRKRAVREKEEAYRYANSSLLESLLPILDNFELGLEAARQSDEAEGIIQGMSMVQKQLTDFLSANGLEIIDAEGASFDPNLHDAIGHEPSDAVAEGIVLRQLRRGYKLRDRLLRAATVIVSKGPAGGAAA